MGQPDGIRSSGAAGKANTFDLVSTVVSGDPGESYFLPTLAQDRVSEVRANSFSAPPILIGELRASAAEKEANELS